MIKHSYKGLDNAAVEQSRSQYGSNKLTQQKSETFWQKYIGNFKEDPIMKILLVALIINVIFMFLGQSHWYESVGIALAVLIASFVGTWSEFSNESAFQKLQEEASRILCKVYRNGAIEEICIDDIVVGDSIVLQTGDMVPSDCIIVEGSLKVDQATLNGESKAATKIALPEEQLKEIASTETAATAAAETTELFSEYHLFRGTVVVSGEAIAKPMSVGDKTVYGKLAQELNTEERDSPLKVKLSALADGISKFGYIGSILIAVAFMTKKIGFENNFDAGKISQYFSDWQVPVRDLVQAVILAVIIIVMAVPEGLPMMVAMVLAQNMKKMLKDNVLVRKLVGIETAGSLNILFSDKTGTITKGQLEAIEFITGEGKSIAKYDDIQQELRTLLHVSLINNTNAIVTECDDKGCYNIIGGNGTEKAVLGFINHNVKTDLNVETVNVVQFSSENKYSAAQVVGDYNLTLIKGAPEKLINKCKFYYGEDGQKHSLNDIKKLDQIMVKMAERSIRILAITTTEKELVEGEEFKDLILVGLLGIRDDVRPEAVAAIKEVEQAGVQVVMVTGDRKETAVAIAKEAGLIKTKDDLVYTSDELGKLSDAELKKHLPHIKVISRALPMDKSRLVKAAQELNMVVGMTGDGVNDAPALKKADVGFAMGSGTEVAKEAGDIVILDDNFNSIAKAVLYGRTIFHSIRKFIMFQLSINVSAVLISLIGPFIGIALPLTIIQILWVNLVMDTLAALAFGGEPALEKYMREKPKRRDENIINKDMWSAILTSGVFVAAASIFFLKSDYVASLFRTESTNTANIYLLTGYFAFFILVGVCNGFSVRTDTVNIFSNLSKNPNFIRIMGLVVLVQVIMTYLGGTILRTHGLVLQEWIVVLIFSILIVPINMIRKLVMKNITE
jgi:P-type Ca2+ transporter type 2C